MINPYFCYAISFTIAILVYGLGWSTLYPQLSWATMLFLIASIILTVIAGWKMSPREKKQLQPVRFAEPHTALAVTIFLYILWSMDFAYEGGIPLLKILLNKPYNYRNFGIPSLHVFIVTFSSFFTVLLFQVYLVSREKKILILYLVNLFAAILIYSRAMFFFNLAGSFFVLLFSVHKFPSKFLLPLLPLLLFLFFFFGMLGTLRVSRETKVPYDNRLFLETGSATERFRQSWIPKEFFWGYIYISSPLANLQNNINTHEIQKPSGKRFLEMANNEILMDFISKRVNHLLHIEREGEHTIPGPFNVSTIYSRSFSYLGWSGMIIMLIVVITLPWLYQKTLPSFSPYYASGMAILCTMYLFMAYDNTIRFTGLCFQLIYPVAFHLLSQKVPAVEKFFVNNKVTTP